MAATTLVAFRLKTQRHVASVKLCGSWDNFTKTYPMERDSKLGRGYWRGCHSFTGIICDGESASPAESVRDGGLLEGGTYWYYYELDDEDEVHDSSRPSTTACPFLPGQHVNILNVPKQLSSEDDSSLGMQSETTAYTMDPGDRFRVTKPTAVPAPLVDRPQTLSKDSGTSPSRPLSRHRSIAATRRPMTGSGRFSERFKDLIRPKLRPLSAPDSRARPWTSEELLRPYTTGAMPDRWDDQEFSQLLSDELAECDHKSICRNDQTHVSDTRRLSRAFDQLSMGTMPDNLAGCGEETDIFVPGCTHLQMTDHAVMDLQDSSTSLAAESRTWFEESWESTPPESDPSATNSLSNEVISAGHGLQHALSVSSNRTSAFFSSIASGSEFGDTNSPRRQSRPMTPTRSDFGEIFLTTTGATPRFDIGAMEVYKLPAADTASALTLQNLETATIKSSSGASLSKETSGPHRLVQAWDDGIKHGKTGLQELVDDLGYLGSLIG